ncbi:hypothetical protein ACF06P_08875 [Streptomyces sp. NPDC015684]|uniref:hypothetical protein n=1 Tax=Streptomyces sp. NPDC015684 TaxID=3364963 RepID=UPI0036F92CDC
MSGILPGARTPQVAAPSPGPVLRPPHVPFLARALGGYSSSRPYWSQVDAVEAFSPGLYLVVDVQGRIVWLGMAAGDLGVTGRIRKHLVEPWKRAVFDRVWVAPAYDQISRLALEAAEGWAADALALRTRMPHRTWPPSTNWLSLVGRQRVA